MKKLLVTLTLLVSVFSSNAQDRVNRAKITFEQSSEVLTNSIGWRYNEILGEWVDYNNVIDKDKEYKEKYKSLQGAYQMSNSFYKFNSIQIKTVKYNGAYYYILLHNKWTGRYKYPSIKQDWVKYKQIDAYIFDEAEYNKIKNYETIVFSNVVKYDLEFEEYDEIKLLDLIQTELSTPKSSYSIKNESKWGMVIAKTKDNNVRFLTPTLLDLVIKYKVDDFTKMYFETDNGNFNKLIIK